MYVIGTQISKIGTLSVKNNALLDETYAGEGFFSFKSLVIILQISNTHAPN